MLTVIVALLSAAMPAQTGSADYVPPPQACPTELVVGCYYFPGHFSPMRWTPFRRAGFPIPVAGFYRDGEPEISDWHIKWAVEHGISFFAFDWYYHYEQGPSTEHNKALDQGFLRARYRDRMKFCLMWCNENRDEHYTDDHITKLTNSLVENYFKQPNYLRVDGDNVLVVSVPEYFLRSFGVEGTAKVFARMSEMCRKAGVGGFFPVAKRHENQLELKQAGFRAITAYNYPEAGMTAEQLKGHRAPYSEMVRGCEEIWKKVTAEGTLPYIVPVAPGWDSRPWYGKDALVRTDPRPELFREMCKAAKRYADPKLRMVIAECWNEFGEGSYVEPTVKYGFGYLDAMRDAFCAADSQHDDIVPLSIGRPAPVFSTIPEPAEASMNAGLNMLYNGDMEGEWGWVLFNNPPAATESPGHQGQRCLVVPAGQGVKTQWLMPIPPGKKVRVRLSYRIPTGATLSTQAALFKAEQWLGRYTDIATLSGSSDQWKSFEQDVTFADPDASRFDIEFVANGGKCLVDDIDIRVVAEASR